MFREMRRYRQRIPEEEAIRILEQGSGGVLAVLGDDGYPYAVPLSYVYADRTVYFHCAASGHKLDALRRYEKVSFCVIARDDVMPQEYTTDYRSVIVFGRARELTDEAERHRALLLLARKYHPTDTEEGRSRAIAADGARVCVVAVSVEHLTGKEGLGLSQRRRRQMSAASAVESGDTGPGAARTESGGGATRP